MAGNGIWADTTVYYHRLNDSSSDESESETATDQFRYEIFLLFHILIAKWLLPNNIFCSVSNEVAMASASLDGLSSDSDRTNNELIVAEQIGYSLF